MRRFAQILHRFQIFTTTSTIRKSSKLIVGIFGKLLRSLKFHTIIYKGKKEAK